MKADPEANQGRGPKPSRAKIGELVYGVICAALVCWAIGTATGVLQ